VIDNRRHISCAHQAAETWPINPAGRDGYQQLFDATLVGADRTKDLAVVQISAPKVLAQVNQC
jgi:S1-C subfamily serine protease